MKLQEEGQRARASLKKTSTVVTDVSGRRYNATTGVYEESSKVGFVEDTSPDPGLHECVPGLYIGSQDAARNWDGMEVVHKKGSESQFYCPGIKEIGISHVVNLCSEEQPFADKGIQYLNCILTDLPEQSLPALLPKPLQFIQAAISQGGKVLVHCNAGVSRSSAIIIAYLIRHQDMKYDQALDQVRTNRATAKPNIGFETQLKELEKDCPKSTSLI
jgi:protein-tyrosine phosphatase